MEIITKGLILLYALAAVTVSAILWQNAGDSGTRTNITIIISSLITVGALAFTYTKAEGLSSHFTYVLLIDGKTGNILTGEYPNPYQSRYTCMFSNTATLLSEFRSEKPFDELMGQKGLRIIEYGIINALTTRFISGWDITVQKRKMLVGTEESWGNNPGSRKGTHFSLEDLRRVFSENPIIASTVTIVGSGVYFPPRTTIASIRPEKEKIIRKIIIRGTGFTTQIQIFASSGGVVPNKIWGIINHNVKNIELMGFNYHVSIETSISPLVFDRNYRAAIKNWHKNIAEILSIYDWTAVEADAESKMSRAATAKILGL